MEKPQALVLLANGFEEIEAVTIIDVLRRAEVQVTTAALEGTSATGSHQITMQADVALDDVGDATRFDAVVLPGGMPGAETLKSDGRVRGLLQRQHAEGKLVAAICAAPIALDAAGILKGRSATSYPGFELPTANYSERRVVEADHVVTSRGPGTALEFALTLVQRLVGVERATKLRQSMLVPSMLVP
jgi:4-methyl-5(b-hydroxyethyl)-thiazole monophosphate biosynthesis